ncbi:hypothetical protein HII36_50625 [Nonomuraea sp. NN258]|uniref:hypothetical protein n=1 Tax=Nonomuraea antri TaxID=2730852 RepID=UPI00156975EE|nr:hypothetical protein [Nonomuraea antri]NRQ40028.1 hypothetical protein [Nonomuraea antri]
MLAVMFTLLLKEVPVHAGAPGAALLGDALLAASARCRLYVLADLAGPPGAPALGAALVEIEPSGREALLVAGGVAPGAAAGLGARLIGDLLTELRAEGVRHVGHPASAGATALTSLLRAAGFAEAPYGPLPAVQAGDYDMPEILWLTREL